MGRGSVVRVRDVKKTALIYCEGAHDLAFIRYLIDLYARNRQLKTKFRTRQGKGGSPDTLVIEARNVPGDFNRKLVKADKDRTGSEIKRAETLAARERILIVWSKPCIEALLLAILDGKDYSRYKSKTCKSKFESTHMPTNKRTDIRAYSKLFPIRVVEDARMRVEELDRLVDFITS